MDVVGWCHLDKSLADGSSRLISRNKHQSRLQDVHTTYRSCCRIMLDSEMLATQTGSVVVGPVLKSIGMD